MIKRNNEFLKEIDKISRIVKKRVKKRGRVKYDREAFKESFFKQSSYSIDNLETMKYIEYGAVRKRYLDNRRLFGIKIKDTDILLSDIIYLLERDETCNLIIKEFPQLKVEEVKAAQRFISIIVLDLECQQNIKIKRDYYFLKEIDKISKAVLESGKANHNRDEFEKSFFIDGSHTPCNLESMKYIEYGEVKKDDLENTRVFGVKIKDKNVLLSDIIDFLDNDEINNLIFKDWKVLTFEEIKAAQRVFRVIFRGLECREIL